MRFKICILYRIQVISSQDVVIITSTSTSKENRYGRMSEATFLIHCGKDKKRLKNDNLTESLHPLDDPRYRAVCPVALIITHALRYSLAEGSTITDIFYSSRC